MKVVDLTSYKKQFKREHRGSSYIATFPKDDKNYYFKRDFEQSIPFETSDVTCEALAEVFSSYFLEKMGAKDFVKYEFAVCENSTIGTLSQSFLDTNVLYIKTFFDMLLLDRYSKENPPIDSSFSRLEEGKLFEWLFDEFKGEHINSVEFVEEIIPKVCETYNIKYDKEDLRDKLIKTAIYDYFMSNEDRNMSNLIFLIKQKGGELYCELAPMFDFNFDFGMGNFIFDRKKEKHFLSQFGISKEGQEIESYWGNKWFKDCGIIVSDIRDAIKNNKEYQEIVQKCLNTDIRQLFDNFEKDYDFTAPEGLKELMIRSYNARVERFKNFESMLKKRMEKINKREQKRNNELLK